MPNASLLAMLDQLGMMPRRRLLNALGSTGASLLLLGRGMPAQAQTAFNCVLAPEMTEGPYWVDEKLNRSDIRVDPSDGSLRPGTLLTLSINVYAVTGSSCGVLQGAMVDVWHCDAGGLYSDEQANNTVGKRYLRGYQLTDSAGAVKFTTVYPGWYSGRTVHIHVRVRTFSGTTLLGQFTSQFFFDDSITDQVFTASPYNTRGTRDTRNSNDNIYLGASNRDRMMLSLAQTDAGYAATINIGVNLQAGTVSTTSYALPQLASGGGWYTALYLANTNSSAASGQVSFLDEAGSPLAVALAGAGTVTSQAFSLAAKSSLVWELPNSGSLRQGWIDAALPAGVIGYGIFRQSIDGMADQEAVSPLSPQTSQSAEFGYDDTLYTTAVALVNPGTSAITVTLTAYGSDGTQVGSGVLALAARSRTAAVLRSISGLSAVAGNRGWVLVAASNGTVAALGLRFTAAGTFTSIPVTHL